MDEVKGSSPFSSTQNGHLDLRLGHFLGGFVAGEGSFFVTSSSRARVDGTRATRFMFQVAVARRDRRLLETLQSFLGAGSIFDNPSRRAGWQPTSTLSIASLRAHHSATIPFADRYLLASAKRRQFAAWRARLEEYDTNRSRRTRSRCSAPGCDGLVRGRGLCRAHYYRATGY
jgi:hypothetical protein